MSGKQSQLGDNGCVILWVCEYVTSAHFPEMALTEKRCCQRATPSFLEVIYLRQFSAFVNDKGRSNIDS